MWQPSFFKLIQKNFPNRHAETSKTKRVLKPFRETRIGDSTRYTDLTVIFGRNGKTWKGRITDAGTLRNGKTFYYVKDAVSDGGEIQSFDIESTEIVKTVSDLDLGYEFCG